MAARLELDLLTLSLRDSERAFHLRLQDIALEQGQVVGLVGESGSGKTMALELIGLLRCPDPGGAYRLVDHQGATNFAGAWQARGAVAQVARLRGQSFGFVPQSGSLLPYLTVAENLAAAQRIAGAVDAKRAAALLAGLGLQSVARAYPAALSIGQRQRAVIARALSHRPAFLIADEPTAALDPENADIVFSLLIDAARQEGAGVLIASHDRRRLIAHDLPLMALAVTPTGQGGVLSRLTSQSGKGAAWV